jgi:hypothetical protein
MRCKWFCSRGLFTGLRRRRGRPQKSGRRPAPEIIRNAPGRPRPEAIIALRGREASSHREEIWQRPRNQTATG